MPTYGMPLIERRSPKPAAEILSRKSEVYQRIYDLLEEHTFTNLTDEWRARPRLDGVKVTLISHPTGTRALKMIDEHNFDRETTLEHLKLTSQYVVLHVNDQSCCIPADIADLIVVALARP